jgi:hypothetical protein
MVLTMMRANKNTDDRGPSQCQGRHRPLWLKQQLRRSDERRSFCCGTISITVPNYWVLSASAFSSL